MVVKNNEDNKDDKKESIGKKIGLWVARLIVMILLLYLAAILFNYLPLLPIYGATYLPLDSRFFKDFNKEGISSQLSQPSNETNGEQMLSIQSGGGDNSPWGGNITDLIDLYKNIWNELKKDKDMKFNLEGDKPNKTVNDLIQIEKSKRKKNNQSTLNAEDTTISNIIKNILRNPSTMKTIRDTMSKKSKHFFAAIPITSALLKIAEFSGITSIDKDGKVVKGTNYGISATETFNNPEKKELSIANLLIEESNGSFITKTVYDVNKFCNKNMIIWYLKQFFVLVGYTISAIFMWPIYYLHEVNIIQSAPTSETGKVEPCQGSSKGRALQIIILIFGLLFMIYNAYARCYSFTESIVSIFKTGKLGKRWSDIILWISIAVGVVIGVIGLILFKNYEEARKLTSKILKGGEKAGSKINSMLSQPLLRGLIDHYGLVKSAFICFIGAIILGSIWSMSLTGSWILLAVFSFFFPICGLILIYLTKSEMSNIFSNNSVTDGDKSKSKDLGINNKIDKNMKE